MLLPTLVSPPCMRVRMRTYAHIQFLCLLAYIVHTPASAQKHRFSFLFVDLHPCPVRELRRIRSVPFGRRDLTTLSITPAPAHAQARWRFSFHTLVHLSCRYANIVGHVLCFSDAETRQHKTSHVHVHVHAHKHAGTSSFLRTLVPLFRRIFLQDPFCGVYKSNPE